MHSIKNKIWIGVVILGMASLVFGNAVDVFAVARTWVATSTTLWSQASNWSPAAVPGAADDLTFSASSTVSSTWGPLGPSTIRSMTVRGAYTGVLTIATATAIVSRNWTWLAAGTSLDAKTSTLRFTGTSINQTFTPGTGTYYNVTLAMYDTDFKASGTVTVANNLVLESEYFSDMSTGTYRVGGNLVMSSTDFGTGGFEPLARITMNGTGTQTISSQGGIFPPVTINASGTVTLSGSAAFRSWIYTAGSLVTANSTLILRNVFADAVVDFIPGSANYYNVTDASYATLVNVSGTANILNDFVISADAFSSINSGTVNVAGNLSVNSTDFDTTPVSPSDIRIVLNGTGTQMISSRGGRLPGVVVNKSSGIAMATTSLYLTRALQVQNGELRTGSSTATTSIQIVGTSSVSAGGTWSIFSSGSGSSTLKFGDNITNNGTVNFNGGQACATYPTIYLTSTTSGSQRLWSGTGQFFMRYVSVKDQGGSASILVRNGASAGNVGANWTFSSTSTINLVQSSTVSSNSAVSISSTFANAPKPTDLIVVGISTKSQAISSVSDNQGNTYTLIASTTANTSRLALYVAKNVSSTTGFTVTANAAGPANFITMTMADYTGSAASSTPDAWTSNIDTVGAVALTGGTMAGTQSNSLYYGLLTMVADTTATAGTGAGWISRAVQNNNSTLQSLYSEDQVITAATSIAPTWTAATTTNYSAIGAIFRPPYPGGYAVSGYLDSSIFDTGVTTGAQLNSVVWQGGQPAGTSVGLQFAVSNSSSGPWTYVGTDGTNGTYYAPNVGVVRALSYTYFNNFRYFRYRVTLFADAGLSSSPTVSKVQVNWSP